MDPTRAKHVEPTAPTAEPAPETGPTVESTLPEQTDRSGPPQVYTGPERRAQGYLIAEVIVETPTAQDSSRTADPAL